MQMKMFFLVRVPYGPYPSWNEKTSPPQGKEVYSTWRYILELMAICLACLKEWSVFKVMEVSQLVLNLLLTGQVQKCQCHSNKHIENRINECILGMHSAEFFRVVQKRTRLKFKSTFKTSDIFILNSTLYRQKIQQHFSKHCVNNANENVFPYSGTISIL